MKSNLHFQSALVFSSDLLQKVNNCISENHCYTIWFGPIWDSKQLHALWMYVPNKTKAGIHFPPAYVNTLYKAHNVLIVLLDEQDLNVHRTMGNTLFKTSLSQDRLLYQCQDRPFPPLLFHPMDSFIGLYREKQALLTSYCQDFVASKINGSTLAYFKALEYNFEVLELLLIGVKNTADTFTKRLLLLERILPQMQTLFVKRHSQTYYLLEDLTLLSQATQDMTWSSALKKVQKKLQQIVEEVLAEIDRKTALVTPKKSSKKKQNDSFKYKEKLLPLLDTHEVEEIYQFHQTLYIHQNKQVKHYYLLAITHKKPSKALYQCIKEVARKDEGVHFTILAHTRCYIQDNVDFFASFFKGILKSKNRVYSNGYYPQIHWHKSTVIGNKIAAFKQKILTDKTYALLSPDWASSTSETFISTSQLHKYFVLKFQLYILHHLRYLPKTKHLTTLLHLALYAQNKEAATLHLQFKQLYPLLFDYTADHKEEKKYNLVLDQNTAKQLQQFFTTLEVH